MHALAVENRSGTFFLKAMQGLGIDPRPAETCQLTYRQLLK
jgi:hypothetical protein